MPKQQRADFDGTVDLERDDEIWTLTLNYARRRNALSLGLRRALLDALHKATGDPTCRVIILTGGPDMFCSGGDISSFEGVTSASGRQRMVSVQEIVRLIIAGPKPVIAAVEGPAVGAGLSLAASCDIVIAASTATFACRFNRIGLLPDLGAAWILPRRMGLGKAKLLMMSGRKLSATEGERQGLVDLLAQPGQALREARALAVELARTAPVSNALLKSILARDGLEATLSSEADIQGLLYGTADFEEGRRAFMEKRPPVFSGR